METATRLPGPSAADRALARPESTSRTGSVPLFVISLDFELYWGVRDVMSPDAYRAHLEGVRTVVPRLLELFRAYDVRGTWATVGFVMLRDLADLRAHVPGRLPEYRRPSLCPYRYVEEQRASLDPALHFAPDLVDRILATPRQELACHTLSHFYCLEEPASVEAFRADLQVAQAIARSRFGVELRSLVFPRNQHSPEHVRVAAEEGFTAYRANPNTWMYRPRPGSEESRLRRAARLADAFFPLSRDLSFALRLTRPVNVPASRFLRPWVAAPRWAGSLQLARIRRELRAAAAARRGYHLWWHPHNFGAHPDQNVRALTAVLDEFVRLRRSHGMRSATMAEASDIAFRSVGMPPSWVIPTQERAVTAQVRAPAGPRAAGGTA